MKSSVSAALLALFALVGCSTPPNTALLPSSPRAESRGSGSLTELFNLDYSTGTITVFSIANNRAKIAAQFTPGGGGAQGIASDAHGRVYTTLTESSGSPCAACVQIYSDAGKLIRQLDAPALQGASGAPSLTDVSVDARDNVYVSDYGQQAVYYFPRGLSKNSPVVVVQNSQNAASVLSTPDAKNVIVSGGCGFASVRPFTRVSRGKYTQGNCFGIGTIALIGGATDDREDVMTPVDGVFGLVSISSPNGGASFRTPDRMASVSGVAFNGDASVAYVANAAKGYVYAFARPANGWLSKKPKLLATYKGFKNLDIIAVPQ